MWSSFFRIVFKVKNYRFLNFPIVAIGVSAFSTSAKHKKNKIEKFKKSYFSKIKYLPKIFLKLINIFSYYQIDLFLLNVCLKQKKF